MRDALEIQDSVARPIDTVTYALDDVVYRNECELLATVSLPKIGISQCAVIIRAGLLTLEIENHCSEGPLYANSRRKEDLKV